MAAGSGAGRKWARGAGAGKGQGDRGVIGLGCGCELGANTVPKYGQKLSTWMVLLRYLP